MSEVKIEIAKTEDAESIAKVAYQVAQLHDEALPEYFRPVPKEEQLRSIQNMLKDEKIVVFKAIYDGKICGFLFLEIAENMNAEYSKFGFILNLGVDEAFRKLGIGQALMKRAEEYLKQRKIEALCLEVFDFNNNAVVFFEKIGFKATNLYMRKILADVSAVDGDDSIKILKANEKDVQEIAKIYNQSSKLHKSFEISFFKRSSYDENFDYIKKILKDDEFVRLMAVKNDKIVGFLFMIIKSRRSDGLTYPIKGYICNFAVEETYRRKGVGEKLIKAAEKYVYKKGVLVLDLDVHAFNQNAFEFYQHSGYNVMYKFMRKVLK
ncbi:MAG: GNAT family N-acetyltransferase [Alphaproteobacteria bacterium]|nr:GNAT family N-acetyltransferase [Alphaproteobacteria bacterium]